MSKRPILRYEEEQLTQAIAAIKGGMKIREASRFYGVPRGTLQDRIHSRVSEGPRKMGPDSVLTKEEEALLADWCKGLVKCGFPLKPNDLLNTVQNIVAEDNRPNPFINNRPGKKWYSSFVRRNPILSEMTAENICKGRAAATELNIRKWFDALLEYLRSKGATDVLCNPERIFNGDETSFVHCAKTGKIEGPRSYKNVYKIPPENEKGTMTVFLFVSAFGMTSPPCIVFPYVRPPKDIVNSMPDEWLLGKSESGWMKAEIFYDYLTKVFDKWIEERRIKKPILVLVDGQKCHLTMQLSQFCEDNDILLYSLPSYATHLMQPADLSVWKPLKSEWKNTLFEWSAQPENAHRVLTKTAFPSLIQKIILDQHLPGQIRQGFRTCGLYPFDPDQLDYSKGVTSHTDNSSKRKNIENCQSPDDKFKKRDLTQAIRVIEHLRDDMTAAGVDFQTVVRVIREAGTKISQKTTGNENADTVVCLPDLDVGSKMMELISNDANSTTLIKG